MRRVVAIAVNNRHPSFGGSRLLFQLFHLRTMAAAAAATAAAASI